MNYEECDDLLVIRDHRELVTRQRQILARLNAQPELAALLVVNPAVALMEFGLQLSQEAASHVLRTRQFPPHLRQRQKQLVAELETTLGERPQPNDPQWVRQLLFEKLQLQPLATEGQLPRYLEALDASVVERLQALRPKAHPRHQEPLRSQGGTVVAIAPPPTAIRRLDLEAPLPSLPIACAPPDEISLETLYFYKDSHPAIQPLLELGLLQRQAFPIQSRDSFRKIKAGEKKNALFRWVNRIQFPQSPDPER